MVSVGQTRCRRADRPYGGIPALAGSVFIQESSFFDQSQPPWGQRIARQAVAYALDRDALATIFGGERAGLFSPVPNSVPGQIAVEPQRDLTGRVNLLNKSAITPANKLAMEMVCR